MFSTSSSWTAVVLTGLALLVAGCGGREPQTVPGVTGERLDVAQERLETAGLRYETVGGGLFGVVVRSRWVVCEQEPKAGALAKTVKLIAARSCPSPRPVRPVDGVVPDVTGERLDVAQDELERLGFRFETYANDVVPIVVPGSWTVCDQYPRPGLYGEVVELYAEHDCDDES